MPGAFLDTNILLYAIGLHPDEDRKRRLAEDIIAPMDWCTSAQVIQEFFVNATRAGAVPADAALAFMELWCRRPVQETTVTLIEAAVAIHLRHRISYWDSTIVAAAKVQRCPLLYSEDFNDGQVIDGVRIINPLR